jgi:glutamate formiminotransferase/glutamate formiminotransferase/formiminotetrahydrofolate cyclodeaminase
MPPIESVPNVSEGRDASAVAAIAEAFSSAGVRVLDTHVDPDHHRAVFTLVGDEHALEDGLVAGIEEACRLIDLRRHQGAHPRVGAADVVPVVPLASSDLPRAEAVARAVGRRVGEELGLPVFFYGSLGDGRRPAFFRRGGPETLQRRIDEGELAPAFGPSRLEPRSGAVLVGARAPLVAFNLELLGTLDVARAVAQAVRESSGGLPGVQALGIALGPGNVQVSTNVIDLDGTPLQEMVERIAAEAAARGAAVGRGELVGLMPATCVAQAAIGVADPLDARGVPTPAALGSAARALRLDRLDADRVVEWHLVG